MESSLKMETSNSNAQNRPCKRLLFDRRYGWVFDEWKDPAEDALAGGRGMFCIVPLGKAFLKMASQMIDVAANSAVKLLEKPDLLSPAAVQANIKDQLHRMNSSMKKLELDLSKLITDVRPELPCPSNLPEDSHK
ncbi:uncharacterized protein LOC107777023 [Nicotiana tabacum]|uniref:Uncharacterized protein LOC107777023 n=1 Tax=Nicotiana tabacum TaxID=4097 RepID=A0A1S3YK44_TOBAC|nr:uncharacterized protein LOC104113557 [Nicotiana tomentosiformis]XP_016452470.1 PREDICTED: uncharacterized protein LOC107777023 [Nicotiana tabacum]